MSVGHPARALKADLSAGRLVVGSFVKTPSPIIVEVLSLTRLHCLCLDAEHAPFDRGDLDVCLLAARAGGMPALVRTPTAAPEHILNALDGGAAGVVLPHIRSAGELTNAVDASQYGGRAGRGYAGSSRAAGYTTKAMPDHRADSAAETILIAQIEDVEALDEIDAIAAVPGVDALFVGRIDLTIALGAEGPDDPRVLAAVDRICSAGQAAGRTVGMFLARPEDAPAWRDKGASFFLLGSDHTFILKGANDLIESVVK